jgi:hypothetical protein
VRNLSLSEKLILSIFPLGILHHIDHALRGDHSGWPFRPEVTLFTFTLLIYPILAATFASYMRSRRRLRAGVVGTVAAFVLLAHTLIEPPQQIFGMWAYNRSTDALLYSVDPEHLHNLLNIESPVVGAAAALLSVVLTVIAIAAFIVAYREACDTEKNVRPHN